MKPLTGIGVSAAAADSLTGCLGIGGPDSCDGYLSADRVTDVPENATVLSYETVENDTKIAEVLERSDPGANESGTVDLSASEAARVKERLIELGGKRAELFVQYENATMSVVIYCPL